MLERGVQSVWWQLADDSMAAIHSHLRPERKYQSACLTQRDTARLRCGGGQSSGETADVASEGLCRRKPGLLALPSWEAQARGLFALALSLLDPHCQLLEDSCAMA